MVLSSISLFKKHSTLPNSIGDLVWLWYLTSTTRLSCRLKVNNRWDRRFELNMIFVVCSIRSLFPRIIKDKIDQIRIVNDISK